VWKLVRRAAGHQQARGALERIFVVTAVIGASIFLFWFLVIEGPGSMLIPERPA
jgi:predicted secreted protein